MNNGPNPLTSLSIYSARIRKATNGPPINGLNPVLAPISATQDLRPSSYKSKVLQLLITQDSKWDTYHTFSPLHRKCQSVHNSS